MKNILKIMLLSSHVVLVATDKPQSEQKTDKQAEVQKKLLDAAKGCQKADFWKALALCKNFEKLSPDSVMELVYYSAVCSREFEAELLMALVERGLDINSRSTWGATALHWAHTRNVAEKLVNAGADVNAQDSSGYVPLMYAVGRCESGMIRSFVALGADTTITTKTGEKVTDLKGFTQCDQEFEKAMDELRKVREIQEQQKNHKNS